MAPRATCIIGHMSFAPLTKLAPSCVLSKQTRQTSLYNWATSENPGIGSSMVDAGSGNRRQTGFSWSQFYLITDYSNNAHQTIVNRTWPSLTIELHRGRSHFCLKVKSCVIGSVWAKNNQYRWEDESHLPLGEPVPWKEPKIHLNKASPVSGHNTSVCNESVDKADDILTGEEIIRQWNQWTDETRNKKTGCSKYIFMC